MGNSWTCPCSDSLKGGVLVMKENGDFIKFKRRILVREVEDAHPGYKIIRCGSNRSVSPESVELENNRLYFLVPEKLVRCSHTYEKFILMAESKRVISNSNGFIPAKAVKIENAGQGMVGQLLLMEEMRKSPWKPGLKTIPEMVSASFSQDSWMI